ncbi:MAG: glycosyltransferase family 39 protein, partial [Pseudomonadota bacterium]
QIAWRYHECFTQEVLEMVIVMATVCVEFTIINGKVLCKWVFLGVAIGLGLLTEPTYYVFVVCLFAAVGLQPGARRAVFQRGLILSGLIALVVASPYLFWLLEDGRRLAAWWALFDLSAIGSIENTWAALRGPVAYLSPLIVILPLVFPGYLQTVWGDLRRGPERGPNADLEQISLHCGVLALAASLVGGLLLGVKGPAVHVLMPLYIPMVIWLFGVARRSSVTSLHVARFTQIALVIAVVAFGARMANMFVLDPVCKTCRWGIPYGALAQTLKEQGVSEAGTIVTVDKELAGNLRRYFPDAPIVNVMYPRFAPHGISAVKGDVTIIWPIGHKKLPVAAIASQITPVLPIGVGMKDATVLTVPWSHLWRDDGYRTSQWAFVRRLPSQPVGAADDGSRIQDTAQ